MDSRYQSFNERRVHQRVNAVMPVEIDSTKGSTIDVSPGGFRLALDHELDLSDTHYFEIRLATDDAIFLTGMAKVLRKEPSENGNHYGMQIVYSKIQVH